MLDNGEKLSELKALADILATTIKEAKSGEVAALAKQYRETIDDIERMEGQADEHDEIDDILSERAADGKAGAVHQDRSAI